MTSDLNHKKTRNGINSLLQKESTAGILLLICTMISVALASFPETEWINDIWDKEGSIRIADFSLDMSLRHWVNDALMAIFFFSVGLEIKREMLFGQLTSLKKSSLPVMAAIGGMAVPALIYSIFNAGEADTAGGWGIPMATDIAFAIGIISLLGSRVPTNLKIFLTALAILSFTRPASRLAHICRDNHGDTVHFQQGQAPEQAAVHHTGNIDVVFHLPVRNPRDNSRSHARLPHPCKML